MKMMKKLLSMVLALGMVCSLSVGAFAADGDSGYSSTLTLGGRGVEEYTITVPATFMPNQAHYVARVQVKGRWAANKTLSISVPEVITMTNERGATFDAPIQSFGENFVWSIPGNDTEEISANETVLVAQAGVLPYLGTSFGTFTGVVYYTINMSESVTE